MQQAYRPPCSEYSFYCPILADPPSADWHPPLADWPPPSWDSWLTLSPLAEFANWPLPPPAESADWTPLDVNRLKTLPSPILRMRAVNIDDISTLCGATDSHVWSPGDIWPGFKGRVDPSLICFPGFRGLGLSRFFICKAMIGTPFPISNQGKMWTLPVRFHWNYQYSGDDLEILVDDKTSIRSHPCVLCCLAILELTQKSSLTLVSFLGKSLDYRISFNRVSPKWRCILLILQNH